MNRKVDVIEDPDGKKTVFIHDIKFKGKRTVNWDDIEAYLRNYVGTFFRIEDYNEVVYIGPDLPDEYAHSEYTKIVKGQMLRLKQMLRKGYRKCLKSHQMRDTKKTERKSITKMQSLAGIPMIPDLPYRYLRIAEKLKGTMCFMLHY